jgi:DNA-binding transcriptional LysR family regulator
MRGVEIRDIRTLIALAELGTISQAAEKFHRTPAAIHKQLKILEGKLGVRLYQRLGRRLQPTQATEILLPYLKDLLARYHAAMSALDDWKGLKRGLVRIGAGPTISSYVLPGLLQKFRRRFPSVDLLVETGNSKLLLDSVGKGTLDLVFLVSSEPAEDSSLSTEASWQVEIVLISNLRQVPRRCSIRELQKWPFILYKQGSRIENLIDRYFAEMDFDPRVIMRFDNAEAIKAMTRAGLGISMMPFWTVDADLKKGQFFMIRQRERALLSKIIMVGRKGGYVPKPVAAFIDLARNHECKNPRLTSRRLSGTA